MSTPPEDALPPDLQARMDQAAVDKAVAEAAKAAADARNADETARKTAAEAAKAAADARGAEATARKTEAEVRDHDSPAAQQERDASARKNIAEADKAAAAARTDQLTALIPDLSEVKESTLEVKEGPALWGTVLTLGALQEVANAIGKRIIAQGPPSEGSRTLVTSDPDLATSDAGYQDVTTGLKELLAAADKLLTDTEPDSVRMAAAALVPDLVAALATAVPSVLSLLSAQRTLGTATVTITDLAASAAVAGVLKANAPDAYIAHDDFRLVPDSGVYQTAADVSSNRQQLIGRKIALEDLKSRFDADLATAKAEEKDLVKQVADADEASAEPDTTGASKKSGVPAPAGGKKQAAELGVLLDNARKTVADLTRKSTNAAVRIGLIDSLVASIDAFTAAIRVVPDGARRSALATAALHGLLHAGAADPPGRFTHVLLVKGQQGQSQQLIENRPLWFEDKFSTVVDVSATFILITTSDSGVVTSGTATATAKAYGKIGQKPEISVAPPTPAPVNPGGPNF